MGAFGMKTKNIGWTIGAIVVVVLLVLGIGSFTGNFSTVEDQKDIVETQGNNEFCANNPNLDLKIRIQDTLATTVSYINGTILLKNLDTGSITSQSVTSGGSSAFTTLSNVLDCKSKLGYEAYLQADADDYNSDGKISISVSDLVRDPVEKTVLATKHTLTKWKAYDADLKANLYGDLVDSDNSTGFITHNGTTLVISTDASVTAKTVGTDGFIDYQFTIAPASANEQSGRDAILCVNYASDSDVNDWDGDTLSVVFDGQTLSEATLSDNDKLALNSYEKCLALPYAIGTDSNGGVKTQHKMDFYIASGSGVNPDMDLTMRLIELGDYQSQKDANSVLQNVGFQDNTARTALGSAVSSVVSIDVA